MSILSSNINIERHYYLVQSQRGQHPPLTNYTKYQLRRYERQLSYLNDSAFLCNFWQLFERRLGPSSSTIQMFFCFPSRRILAAMALFAQPPAHWLFKTKNALIQCWLSLKYIFKLHNTYMSLSPTSLIVFFFPKVLPTLTPK